MVLMWIGPALQTLVEAEKTRLPLLILATLVAYRLLLASAWWALLLTLSEPHLPWAKSRVLPAASAAVQSIILPSGDLLFDRDGGLDGAPIG